MEESICREEQALSVEDGRDTASVATDVATLQRELRELKTKYDVRLLFHTVPERVNHVNLLCSYCAPSMYGGYRRI